MSQNMEIAQKTMKAATAEMVQWENRIEGMKETHNNMLRQKEALESEINRKRADFDNYISMKDSDIKKGRESMVVDQQTLLAQKEEFKKVLQQHEIDKSNYLQAVKEIEIDRNKLIENRGRVDQFIIALQRAYTLIG